MKRKTSIAALGIAVGLLIESLFVVCAFYGVYAFFARDAWIEFVPIVEWDGSERAGYDYGHAYAFDMDGEAYVTNSRYKGVWIETGTGVKAAQGVNSFDRMINHRIVGDKVYYLLSNGSGWKWRKGLGEY